MSGKGTFLLKKSLSYCIISHLINLQTKNYNTTYENSFPFKTSSNPILQYPFGARGNVILRHDSVGKSKPTPIQVFQNPIRSRLQSDIYYLKTNLSFINRFEQKNANNKKGLAK
jgi:hypothetical protein